MAIRTSTLEEKATACSMIGCYVDELKEGFFPYVKQARLRGEGISLSNSSALFADASPDSPAVLTVPAVNAEP